MSIEWAEAGDGHAFAALVEPHRRELQFSDAVEAGGTARVVALPTDEARVGMRR